MKLRSPLILPLAAFVMLTGCKTKPVVVVDPVKGRSAETLLAEGELKLKRGNWEEGRKTLRIIEEYLPSAPELPRAKLLIADSFFFSGTSDYPLAAVEYQSFLNYFPRHAMRDYALYRIALCHFSAIVDAERDQTETRKALEAFQQLLQEMPGSPYAVDVKSKITQCWRRLAESELMVGIFYVNSSHYAGAEKRIKDLLEAYPEYVDRERAYYYLGEALRNKTVPKLQLEQFQKDVLARIGKDDAEKLTPAEQKQLKDETGTYTKGEVDKYHQEARDYYQKLVESYPRSPLTGRAKDRLIEMGQTNVQEELDS